MDTNLTFRIDRELLLKARKLALKRGTSVNQLVRCYLTGLIVEGSSRQRARAQLKAAFTKDVVKVDNRNWKRKELYER